MKQRKQTRKPPTRTTSRWVVTSMQGQMIRAIDQSCLNDNETNLSQPRNNDAKLSGSRQPDGLCIACRFLPLIFPPLSDTTIFPSQNESTHIIPGETETGPGDINDNNTIEEKHESLAAVKNTVLGEIREPSGNDRLV